MSIARTLAVVESKEQSLLKDVSLVILSSLLLALSSKVSIPLFFTPVPITIQNSLILLLAVLLGPRKGGAVVASLLAQTVMGFSVLSSGAVGLASFVGPTGGYLVGYLASAVLTGWLMERVFQRTVVHAFCAMLMGNVLVYLLGAGFLSTIIGVKAAFWLGVAPFILGDLWKLLATAKLLQYLGWK
ncbi:MAG: biotin transporter BioY [Chlamydiales bacterium]|nr:biotin transporter BioY [Chlamydiales bacterium]